MSNASDKIALVFHGIVGGHEGRNGKGAPIDLVACSQLIHHFITSKYDTDIFIHSWSKPLEDQILSVYNPKKCLFEEQDYFGFTILPSTPEEQSHRFRTISRYTSLEKAMSLKQQYEHENNFQYKWVMALRFDLTMLNPINFDALDPSCFYVPDEPHWPNMIYNGVGMVHDIFFIASSPFMDEYAKIASEIRQSVYQTDVVTWTHILTWQKLHKMFPDYSKVRYAARRFDDVEVYRLVVHPELNPLAAQYGGYLLKDRMNTILSTL